MRVNRVNAYAENVRVDGVEVCDSIGKCDNLSRADEREIEWVEEQNQLLATVVRE